MPDLDIFGRGRPTIAADPAQESWLRAASSPDTTAVAAIADSQPPPAKVMLYRSETARLLHRIDGLLMRRSPTD